MNNINKIPNEIVRVPFILEIINGVNISTQKMKFWAGFMGFKQNVDTYNLKPEIGWAINKVVKK